MRVDLFIVILFVCACVCVCVCVRERERDRERDREKERERERKRERERGGVRERWSERNREREKIERERLYLVPCHLLKNILYMTIYMCMYKSIKILILMFSLKTGELNRGKTLSKILESYLPLLFKLPFSIVNNLSKFISLLHNNDF